MNLLLNLILDLFATKRLTRLVVDDAILNDARNKFYEKYPPESTKIGYLITCHACSSVWAAAIVKSGFLPRRLRDTLALSEMALAAKKLIGD
jgi:hypothetical protein